jgi:hypothetical protein
MNLAAPLVRARSALMVRARSNKTSSPFDWQDVAMLLSAMGTVLVVALVSTAAAIGTAIGLFVAGLAIAIKVRAWHRYWSDLECPECGHPIG